MSDAFLSMFFQSEGTVFAEIVEGAASSGGWVLNPNDGGLLKSLERLSYEEASAVRDGGASIAAHVDHLCYGLSLLNRWNAGEKDPFSSADYSQSWRRLNVSEAEWKSLRERLRDETQKWRAALETPRELSEIEMNGIVASVAHLAYHLGAIRQINRLARGPSADD
jgi:hypothetical protein